jgi:hypothetical protein
MKITTVTVELWPTKSAILTTFDANLRRKVPVKSIARLVVRSNSYPRNSLSEGPCWVPSNVVNPRRTGHKLL